MTATEAKKLTLEALSEKEMPKIYKRIEAAAILGSDRLRFKPSELNEYKASILRKKGYSVIEDRTDCHSYDRSELLGWDVSW